MKSSVIICGNDATLLATRRMLLERAGFTIQTALGVSAMQASNGEPLILCHSLSESEQLVAIQAVRADWPTAKILVLGGDVREDVSRGCESLGAYEAPVALIEKTRQLVQ